MQTTLGLCHRIALVVLGLGWIGIALGCPGSAPLTGGTVSGSVYVEGSIGEGGATSALQVALPDIQVELRRSSDDVVMATDITDSFGRYYFRHQDAGIYELHWAAQLGWAAGQLKDPIVVSSGPRSPLAARIVPEARKGVLFGKATFSEGSTVWSYDELFQVNSAASVTVLNLLRTETLAGPIHANGQGYFAAAGLPSGENLSVRIVCEAANDTRSTSAADVSFGSSTALAQFALPNAPPEVVDLVPTVAGEVVKTAAPGDTITVTAVTRDSDGDPLTHTWAILDGNGSIAPSGASVQWTLPSFTGTHCVYLQVADGRGGYARQRIDFTSGLTHVTFSGLAVDKSAGTPVGGASVTVNGDVGTTDANGWFSVRAALADRYVMNIEARGYALFARVVDSALTGQTWKLVKTQSEQVDPTQPITIVDRRPELEQRKGKGMHVRVPAGALVDSAGNPPTGLLTAHVATLDIADGEAPGDWGGLIDGHETNLTSFGCGFVEFLDAGGTKYNLAPGTTAEVEFFAPSSLLASAPPSTPTWDYNPKNGYWEVSGASTFVPASGSYVNRVEHFSTKNTDLEKEDAACLGVLIYPPIPTGAQLRVTDGGGGAFSQTFDFVLDAGINAVYRLPANTDVRLELLNADGTPYALPVVLEETPGLALSGNVVNTGTAIPAGESLWPPAPYVPPCKLVILRQLVIPPTNSFFYLGGEGDPLITKAYYDFIDPLGTDPDGDGTGVRDTLREWWETNEFTFADDNGNGVDDADFLEPPTNAVRTSYLNYNDLGSGRDMYFLQRANGDVAAYVTNYGEFDQDLDDARRAVERDDPKATVCMEWSPIVGQGTTRVVKFFVYAGNDFGPNALRQLSANLDTFGEKHVPNLCTNCHGGISYGGDTTPTFADVNMGASFRELDIATYKFVADAAPTPEQKAAFHEQNLIARGGDSDTISVQAIKDLIDGWYLSGTDDQDNDIYVPPGFAGTNGEALYTDLVRHSCRTCHVALDPITKNWTTYDQLKAEHIALKGYVLCGLVMPHAVTTYRNFWLSTSPHQPAVLRDFEDIGVWDKLGPCFSSP